MEAAFLGAAAAAERQVRPARLELNRARAVFIPSPAIRGRAEFPGVDCGKNLRAAAAARASESSGPGHGATMRDRTLPARSASSLHPSRTPFPTSTHPRSSLSRALRQPGSMIQRLSCNDGLLDIHARIAHCASVRGGIRRSNGACLRMHVACSVRFSSLAASMTSGVGDCKLRHCPYRAGMVAGAVVWN